MPIIMVWPPPVMFRKTIQDNHIFEFEIGTDETKSEIVTLTKIRECIQRQTRGFLFTKVCESKLALIISF
jgi:hypothetical protein